MPVRPLVSRVSRPHHDAVISERGVAFTVDPRKVTAVAEWATPDVRRFVGLANYYRKFVLRFSALAALLTDLCTPHSVRLGRGRARLVVADVVLLLQPL